MTQPPSTDPRLTALHDLLRARIAAAGGRISFREYMDMALYAPGLGYYAVGAVVLGRNGDFVTSPEVDPAFGRVLARWLARVDAALGSPPRFQALEMGAGTGRLAHDILLALHEEQPDLYHRVQYQIIERSPALRDQQQQLLALLPAASVAWIDSLAALPPAGLTGAIFSNELVDAFPVHRFVMTEDGLAESYVALNAEDGLREVLGPPSTPALAAHLDWLGVTPPPGTRGEINLDAVAWMQAVARVLGRGAVLTIDYGDTAERLYSGQRPDGTLLCYTGGRVTDDPFAAPGAQDMTAHVDFTALQQAGSAAGLLTVALTRQMTFLAEGGLGEILGGLVEHYSAQAAVLGVRAASSALLQTRARLLRLLDPDGLGRFHVLIQARNIEL